MRVMLATAHGVPRFRLALCAGLHEDGFGPQKARGGALLQRLGKQSLSNVSHASSTLKSHSFEHVEKKRKKSIKWVNILLLKIIIVLANLLVKFLVVSVQSFIQQD